MSGPRETKVLWSNAVARVFGSPTVADLKRRRLSGQAGFGDELSRLGQPWHRVERLQHIVGWFDVYLQGKQTDAYDVK